MACDSNSDLCYGFDGGIPADDTQEPVRSGGGGGVGDFRGRRPPLHSQNQENPARRKRTRARLDKLGSHVVVLGGGNCRFGFPQ